DGAIPAADREEAQPVTGTSMGLHGTVLGPRAAAWWKAEAQGQVGPSPRRVGGEQGMGAPRYRRQPGSHHVGLNAHHPADGHLDGDTPSARRGH
ncbi:unnamed protein product, partial [Closterium sp. NIES-54]